VSKLLRISPDLGLPLDIVTSTLVVYGSKGMGKTVLAAVLAEELAAVRLRWSWLDPLGVGYGIRYAADGRGPGVECLILGGVHGDIPIEPDGGAAVADVVVEESVNILIDFSRRKSGEMWAIGEKIRFVTAYAKRLFQRQGDIVKGRRREPLFQILDEAARYIPQNFPAGHPELALCLAAWQQLVEEGRNVALGVGLVTQRSARMSKDVSELADAMFAFRTIGPNSLGAVLDWLGEHVERKRIKDLAEQVRKLPRGSALVVSPGWLDVERVVAVRMRKTFDSSATPKAGQRAKTARGDGAKPNLDAIRARMAVTIEKSKADDPKELRKRILELERQVKAKVVPVVNKVGKTERIEVKVPFIPDKQLRRIESLGNKLGNLSSRAGDLSAQINQATEDLLRIAVANVVKAVPAAPQRPLASPAPAPGAAPVKSPPKPTNRPLKAPPVTNGAGLPAGERAVLTAIAQTPAGVTRQQISILAGYKKSTRNAYLSRLSVAGYVEETGDLFTATEQGLGELGSGFKPLPVGKDLREHWLQHLPEGERKVFGVVVDAYPDTVDRETIGERTEFKKSTRNAYISRLNVRKIIVISRDGITAAKELFN
jgi:hypothetical protein